MQVLSTPRKRPHSSTKLAIRAKGSSVDGFFFVCVCVCVFDSVCLRAPENEHADHRRLKSSALNLARTSQCAMDAFVAYHRVHARVVRVGGDFADDLIREAHADGDARARQRAQEAVIKPAAAA